MESNEDQSLAELESKNFKKFRAFMIGIAKIDELGIAGSRLLSGFQQASEFIRRPPIDMNSKLVDKIIVANETKRVKAYINSGCRKLNESIQSLTNFHSCTQGLCNHIRKAKEILNELEGLLGDVTSAIQTTDGKLLAFSGLDFDVELIEQVTYNDLAMVMAFIYSMVKQDYLMQEKIVSALDLKMSLEELESYCQMWSLRPFINDEIVHGAWEHIH
ncbi:uncharacterized protein LOC106757653 [Vigna radiata var. radiata]|uniref:Uncharacterized protein LOC106757653 n=1 Tax=Vigna radiata var. radiata TaxID=3916 RepID=A0A1S3TQ12_VIGRR|nr:uncharacterized protein LOC106757653 [Vigna radiata var. radiata]